MTEITRHITVGLPEELLARARRKAAAEGRTLGSLVEEGLRVVVSDNRPTARKRGPVPVSKATGGFRPSIDLTSYSALQELDDIEYVERMKHFK